MPTYGFTHCWRLKRTWNIFWTGLLTQTVQRANLRTWVRRPITNCLQAPLCCTVYPSDERLSLCSCTCPPGDHLDQSESSSHLEVLMWRVTAVGDLWPFPGSSVLISVNVSISPVHKRVSFVFVCCEYNHMYIRIYPLVPPMKQRLTGTTNSVNLYEDFLFHKQREIRKCNNR